jgi:putative flippase GtrA
LRFAFVGVVGAVVDFGTFNLLTHALGVPAILAQVISFTAAIASNFLWNRYWTYPDSRSKPLLHQLSQFAAISIAGLVIRACSPRSASRRSAGSTRIFWVTTWRWRLLWSL